MAPHQESYEHRLDRLCREHYGTSIPTLKAQNASLKARNAELEAKRAKGNKEQAKKLDELKLRNAELKVRQLKDMETITKLEGRLRKALGEIKRLEEWYGIVLEKLGHERKMRKLGL